VRRFTAALLLLLTVEAIVLNNLRARDPMVLQQLIASHHDEKDCSGCAAQHETPAKVRQATK